MRYLVLLLLIPLVFTIGCTCDYSTGAVSYGCFNTITACSGDVDIVSPTGTIELQNPVWATMTVTVGDLVLPPTSCPELKTLMDDGVSSVGTVIYWFHADYDQHVFFTVEAPHDYQEGTPLYFHIHWTPLVDGAVGQLVVWELEYTWANEGEVYPNTSVILNAVHIPVETLIADKHYVTNFGVLDPINPAAIQGDISSVLACRLARLGTNWKDDYTNYVGFLSCDFHYQKDTMGSRNEWAK